MIPFLIAVACIFSLVRFIYRFEGNPDVRARWAKRVDTLRPLGRHVRDDVKALRRNISDARAARRLRRSL